MPRTRRGHRRRQQRQRRFTAAAGAGIALVCLFLAPMWFRASDEVEIADANEPLNADFPEAPKGSAASKARNHGLEANALNPLAATVIGDRLVGLPAAYAPDQQAFDVTSVVADAHLSPIATTPASWGFEAPNNWSPVMPPMGFLPPGAPLAKSASRSADAFGMGRNGKDHRTTGEPDNGLAGDSGEHHDNGNHYGNGNGNGNGPGNGNSVFVPDNHWNGDDADTNVTLYPSDHGSTIVDSWDETSDPVATNDLGTTSDPGDPTPVPEPTSLVLLGSGLVLAGRTLKNRLKSRNSPE